MMASGPKEICVLWLRTALSNYVIIDEKKFEASLLSGGRNVTLENLKLIEQKIPLAIKRNSSTFITISGTIAKLSFEWKWTSLLLLEYSRIEIQGIKVTAVLSVEATGMNQFPEQGDHSSKTEADDKENDGSSEKRSLYSIAMKEYRRFLKSLRDIVPSSEILRRALYHFTNTLSIRVIDVELIAMLSEHQGHSAGDLSPPTFVMGLRTFEFLPTSGTSLRNSTSPAVETIRFFHIGIGALYFNVVDGKVSLPVLEPFSYAATVRRVYGMRFVDTLFGYEIIGKASKAMDATVKFSDKHGMIIHVGATRIGAINTAYSFFFDGSSDDAASPLPEKVKGTTQPKTTRTFSRIIMFLVGSFMFVSTWWAYANIFTVMKIIGKASTASSLQMLSISFRLVLIGSVVLVLRWSSKLMGILSKPGDSSWNNAANKVAASKDPAVYRLPLAYLRIIGLQDSRIDFINLAIMGRLDGTVLNISADSIDVAGKNPSTGLRVEANGIRAIVNDNGTIVNIDSIDDLFIPQTMSLTSPIRRTVLRFQDGKALLKINSVFGTKISSVPVTTEKNGGLVGNNKMVDKPSRKIDKDEIRRRINTDIATETQQLKVIARMFEGIPVQTVTRKLKRYKKAFRGSEGVNYLLELNVANTREEALQIGRSLQTEFDLFQDADRDFFAFQDDYESLYQFVDETKRRSWGDQYSSARDSANVVQHDPCDTKLIPFPVTIKIAKLVIHEENGDWLVTMLSTYIRIKPALFVSAVELVTSVDTIENQMLLVTNARVQAYYHPDLPREIYKLVYSVDLMSATGGFSAESWLHALGFIGDADGIKIDRRKKNKALQVKSGAKAPTGVFALPFVYLAPFTLKLIFQSTIAQARESRIRVNAFKGTEKTTSNDLILYFVMVVLARTPGMVKNIDLFGMNVSDLTGVGTGISVGAKLVPGGHFIGLGVILGYDIISGVIGAGKKARGNPDDRYKPGDILRGAVFTIKEVSRKGAMTRGKTADDFYDENDKVRIDPADFAVGATEGAGTYLYANKGRYAGAAVAGTTMVAATVVLGPWAGLAIGLLAGQATEFGVNKVESAMIRRKEGKVARLNQSTQINRAGSWNE